MQNRKIYKFKNTKVIDIKYFNYSFDEGYIIYFDNGLCLTAQDGEYGDNVFVIYTKEQADKKLKDKRRGELK